MRCTNLGLQFLLVLAASGFVIAAESRKAEPGIHVECHGQLRHGIVAIGGETTGTTISFNRMIWELKLPDDAMRTIASERHKQPVTAVGRLCRVQGTQVPVRWILEVDRLAVPDAQPPKSGAVATVIGKLRHEEAITGAGQQLVIEADGITLPLEFDRDEKLADKAKSIVGKMAMIRGEIVRSTGADAARRIELHVTRVDVLSTPGSGTGE